MSPYLEKLRSEDSMLLAISSCTQKNAYFVNHDKKTTLTPKVHQNKPIKREMIELYIKTCIYAYTYINIFM